MPCSVSKTQSRLQSDRRRGKVKGLVAEKAETDCEPQTCYINSVQISD
jgi:hypothetical protein